MALNVNALPDYIEVNKDELFVKAVAGTKTLDYIEIMANVKGKAALNYLDSTVVLADGSLCGWDPQGEDTFTQKEIETKLITVQKEFCWKDLRNKWANYQLAIAAGRETLPFEQKIAESNTAAIQKEVEKLVWQGLESVELDGLLAQIADESASVKVSEGTNAVEKVEAVIAAIPGGALEKGVNVFLSWTDFRAYVAAKNASCCGNMPIIDAAVAELVYAGDSRIKLVPVAGLEGTGKIVAAPYDALVYATDIEDADAIYRMFFDAKESKHLFEVVFNSGTAVKFADEVVMWTDETSDTPSEGGDDTPSEGGDDDTTTEGE